MHIKNIYIHGTLEMQFLYFIFAAQDNVAFPLNLLYKTSNLCIFMAPFTHSETVAISATTGNNHLR